jgi:hypothetical protein
MDHFQPDLREESDTPQRQSMLHGYRDNPYEVEAYHVGR